MEEMKEKHISLPELKHICVTSIYLYVTLFDAASFGGLRSVTLKPVG
jgi:hypothetical protein